jgi:cathepsin X
MMKPVLLLALFNAVVNAAPGCKCHIPLDEPLFSNIRSPLPHSYLKTSDLPERWDWRNVNGTNFCNKVMTQQNPHVCGSCWAEAATGKFQDLDIFDEINLLDLLKGAMSDRYAIATNNRLRVQLAPQALLNFKERISGGACTGGNSLKAYRFMNKYGVADDTCAPFSGINWEHGFTVADMVSVEDVQNHQCFLCTWGGNCVFAPREFYDLYGVDEYGTVYGIEQMKAEIYARGPISCALNSEATEFNAYHGGIIRCDKELDKECQNHDVDHELVIAGWGVDKETNTQYWVGRNSYGTQVISL